MKRVQNAALAGIGLMLLACFFQTANGALAKGLLTGLPLTLVLLLRSGTSIALVLPFTTPGQFLAMPHPRRQLLRALLCTFEASIYLFVLTRLPLADCMTYYLSIPIIVTAISVFLGERIDWRRWCAVLIGFLGVVITLRPSMDALSWPALLNMAGALLYAVIMLLTRSLHGTSSPVLLVGQHVGVMVFAGLATLLTLSEPVAMTDVALMSFLGGLTLAGAYAVNRSIAAAPPSIVSPYQYSLMIWGPLFGYLFFDEIPRLTTIMGGLLIVASGLYIFMREKKTPAPARAEPPA
ncbi:MAG: DMT family transporter [Pseudorhodoplanes sp.]